ncbi:ret finger protein-like 4A [Microcebus murinus]|uniref:ret finger protein-like 4A n=1 Tax=Microcebus murinus TaxID=30608 RepID=UPI003F6B27C2
MTLLCTQRCSQDQPVDMMLDVDIANNRITSDNLRNLRCVGFKQNRKGRAERFNCALCVLGSPRFTSSRHFWEVGVGTSKEWDMGVCKESVTRQRETLLSSEWGFCTVGVQIYIASTTAYTSLWVNHWSHRVGTFLDVDVGTVSFYNLIDGSYVFTFTKISTVEPLSPFFAPADQINVDQGFLSICPVTNPGIALGKTNKTVNTGTWKNGGSVVTSWLSAPGVGGEQRGQHEWIALLQEQHHESAEKQHRKKKKKKR